MKESFDVNAFLGANQSQPAAQSGDQQKLVEQKQRDMNLNMAGYTRDDKGNVIPISSEPVTPPVGGQPVVPDMGTTPPASSPKPADAPKALSLGDQEIAELRTLIGKPDGDVSYVDIKGYVETALAQVNATKELLTNQGVFINDSIKANKTLLQKEDKDLALDVLKGVIPDDQLGPYVDKLILNDTLSPLVKGHRQRIEAEIAAEEAKLKTEHEAQVAQRVQQSKPIDPAIQRQSYIEASKDVKNVYGLSLGKTDAEITETIGKAATALSDGSFVNELVGNKKSLMEMYILWSHREKLKDIFTQMGAQQGKADLLLNELGNVRVPQQGLPVPVQSSDFDPIKFNGRG